jgi:hypothetical protein
MKEVEGGVCELYEQREEVFLGGVMVEAIFF